MSTVVTLIIVVDDLFIFSFARRFNFFFFTATVVIGVLSIIGHTIKRENDLDDFNESRE